MTILKDISVMWSLIHTLVMFLFLFESRYPRKKTLTITLVTMVPLILVNFVLFILLGPAKYGPLMLLTLSLPSCIVFYILAKYRGGRFFFTFCMIDTTVLEVIYITNILNHYLTPNSYLVTFIVRMAAYPLIELWLYKKLRLIYLDVQRQYSQGWGVFGIIGVSFYLAITLLMTYPTPIIERPEYIPVLSILFVLMPAIYLHIITTLRHQQDAHKTVQQKTILNAQVANLTARMDEFAAADQRFRVERHNVRHKLNTIAAMIQQEQYDDCLKFLAEYEQSLDKTRVVRYCQHPVLDAMLYSYISKAQSKDIRLDLGFAFPDEIPVDEIELATAIANALENAINACEKLPQEERFIEIKVIQKPRFMMRIVNSYHGDVQFDEDDIPVSHVKDHGLGAHYIAAFCNKYGGYYQFSADNDTFTLLLNF